MRRRSCRARGHRRIRAGSGRTAGEARGGARGLLLDGNNTRTGFRACLVFEPPGVRFNRRLVRGLKSPICRSPISLSYASGPDRVAPGTSAGWIYQGDTAVRAAERSEVELRLRDRLAIRAMALLAALPPVAAPCQRDRVRFARLHAQPLAVHEQLTKGRPLRRVVAPGLERSQQGLRVELGAVNLHPPAEAIFRVAEVRVVPGVDQQPAATLQKSVEHVGPVGLGGQGGR